MKLWLGIRMAFAGGRESVARMVLMVAGIAIGVMLVLFPLTAMPVQQAHIDRLAWHRTDAASPATAPDPALWLPVTDRYAGQDVIRVQVAVPPAPGGCCRWPPGCWASGSQVGWRIAPTTRLRPAIFPRPVRSPAPAAFSLSCPH